MTDTRWDNAIRNISDYLIEKENDGEGEVRVLHLLYEVMELLEEGKGQDVEGTQEEERSTRSTETILQSIEDRLTRIEGQNQPQRKSRRDTRTANLTYVATAKRNGGDDGPQTTPRSIGPRRPEDLKSGQRKGEKEITIRVSDETERYKLHEDETKELMKRIKNVVSEFIKMNRLTNDDIKIIVTNKEIKTVLLKNIE